MRVINNVAAIAAILMTGSLLAADTVKVGRETKKTVGVVTELENGDVACYVTLKDDGGVVFRELADFEICSQQPSLIGKRVMLKYALQKVMADECQGDPDCGKTSTVALITEARVLGGTSTGPTSLCTPIETVVFACRTGQKLVAVCASRDSSRARSRAYLQYRFGLPDLRAPLEIVIPRSRPDPSSAATGATVPFSGGGGAWLRFRNGQTAYVVYTGIGKWGPKGETREKQGVVVERAGKPPINLRCTGPLTSILGPEWFEKNGVMSNGEEFDFPD